MDTPASLLERLRQPAQEQAWARFVELYTPFLYSWVRRLGCPEADAPDLVQEVLILLVRELPAFRYDPGRSFRAWLRTVTRNRWRDWQRRRQPPASLDDLPAAEPAAPEEDAFWEVEYRQYLVGRAVDVMRAEFQPATWKACWEFVVCGRPAAEVAAELGISENAVYIAKHRVLRRLRAELQGLMD
jgi:RNA polymerase sigma-70 factor, ECF subfamily